MENIILALGILLGLSHAYAKEVTVGCGLAEFKLTETRAGEKIGVATIHSFSTASSCFNLQKTGEIKYKYLDVYKMTQTKSANCYQFEDTRDLVIIPRDLFSNSYVEKTNLTVLNSDGKSSEYSSCKVKGAYKVDRLSESRFVSVMAKEFEVDLDRLLNSDFSRYIKPSKQIPKNALDKLKQFGNNYVLSEDFAGSGFAYIVKSGNELGYVLSFDKCNSEECEQGGVLYFSYTEQKSYFFN